MYTCGMYNYSGMHVSHSKLSWAFNFFLCLGEFAFLVGLPAKSGVSGDLLLVVPGVMGIAIWSPRLDKIGNSVRAVEMCKELTRRLRIHGHDRLPKAIYSDESNHTTSVGRQVQSFSQSTVYFLNISSIKIFIYFCIRWPLPCYKHAQIMICQLFVSCFFEELMWTQSVSCF